MMMMMMMMMMLTAINPHDRWRTPNHLPPLSPAIFSTHHAAQHYCHAVFSFRIIRAMIESDILFPWLDPNLHAMQDQLKDLNNCAAMSKVRRFKQMIQRHPVASVFLGTFIITGFLPFFLFLAFVAGSSIFVLFSILLFQGGVLAMGLLSLLGVFVPIVLFGTKIAAIVYIIYIITATVLRVLHVLMNTIMWLPFAILTGLNQKIHDVFSRLGDAVRVELHRRCSMASCNAET